MKIGAAILGVIGGVIGIVAGLLAPGAGAPVGIGVAVIILSILGILAGGLAALWPKPAGVLMLVVAVGGFVLVVLFYIIPGILLFAGGLLAILTISSPRGMKKA